MENNGPIISRGDTPKDKVRRILLIMAAFFFIAFYSMYTVITSQDQANYESELTEDWIEDENKLADIINELPSKQTEIEDKEEEVIEEKQKADFYYKRALEKEKLKDYNGADEDYTKTISLAKKYSSEMWNALNNRGIIRAKQFKNYKSALKDFTQIIETEINRVDGNINYTRLEAGYSNRAFVKKMRGDKDGACDDLYLALGVSSESSVKFIEEQINKNCY